MVGSVTKSPIIYNCLRGVSQTKTWENPNTMSVNKIREQWDNVTFKTAKTIFSHNIFYHDSKGIRQWPKEFMGIPCWLKLLAETFEHST